MAQGKPQHSRLRHAVQDAPRKFSSPALQQRRKAKSPPRPAKKTYSINGLLGQDQSLKKKHERYPNVLSPRPARIQKPSAKTPGPFKHFLDREKEQEKRAKAASPMMSMADQDYFAERRAKMQRTSLGLAEAINQYIEDTATTWQEKLDLQVKAFEASRKGVDAQGNPLSGTGVPTDADFEELTDRLEMLNRDFDDEMVSLNTSKQQDDGSYRKEFRVGRIKADFFTRLDRRQAQLSELEEQHRLITEEIAELKANIVGEGPGSKKAAREREQLKAGFQKEFDQIEKQAKADREEMKKEEREATKEVNRRIKELWDAIA